MKWGVSPTLIYEEGNYVTYNLASNYQSIRVSYYLLQEIFFRQSPEIVFCDIFSLCQNMDMDYTCHMMTDNIPMSRNKLEAAKSYAEVPSVEGGGQNKEKAFLTIISPLYCYRGRWEELIKSDFLKPEKPDYDFLAGYYMTAVVSGTSLRNENVNYEVNAMNDSKGFRKEFFNGT